MFKNFVSKRKRPSESVYLEHPGRRTRWKFDVLVRNGSCLIAGHRVRLLHARELRQSLRSGVGTRSTTIVFNTHPVVLGHKLPRRIDQPDRDRLEQSRDPATVDLAVRAGADLVPERVVERLRGDKGDRGAEEGDWCDSERSKASVSQLM